MMNEKKMDFEDVMKDIFYHFRIYIYLKRQFQKNGKVIRYISDIVQLDENGKTHLIYAKKKNKTIFSPLSKDFLSLLNEDGLKKLPEVFK